LVFVLPAYLALSDADGSRELSGVAAGLVATIGLSAMLAASTGLLVVIANSLDFGFAGGSASSNRLIIPRARLVAVAACAGYLVKTIPAEPFLWMAWAFSLAAAGYFPALVLGIWWKRATTAGAICGMTTGFGLCLFYIAVSRYFPQVGVQYLGMSSLLNSGTGQAMVNATEVLADPRWVSDMPASAANPLASRVGWLNVGNAACGILGLFTGFVTNIAISLLGRTPSAQTQALVDSMRGPRRHASADVGSQVRVTDGSSTAAADELHDDFTSMRL
jgi:cation/acetate symporter